VNDIKRKEKYNLTKCKGLQLTPFFQFTKFQEIRSHKMTVKQR